MLDPLSAAAIDTIRRWLPVALAVLIGLGLIAAGFSWWNRAANAVTEGRVVAAQAEAGRSSAKVAIDAVAASSAAERTSETQSRESEDAIRAAPGADAPVDPALRDVGLDRLCARRTYRCSPACVQRAAARGVADAGAGCPPA
jgi:hypothetical protein